MSDGTDAAPVPDGNTAEDDALLAELRMMASQLDPVPPEAIAAARSAIAWRTMDAELAGLTADSSMEPELAGVRGSGMPTLLTFDAPDLTVEIEVVEQAGRLRRILGQLVPPGPGTVEVRHGGGTQATTADEVGRFSVADLPTGPLSLRCVVGERVVETDWFLA